MEELDYKMIGSPPLSDQGKMVIKLKFPKLEKDIENESKNDDQDYYGEAGLMMKKKMNVRVCQECKKEFSSGKALGGHMRVHFIQSNSSTTFNNKQNPNSNSSSSKKVKKDFKVAVNKQKKQLAAAVKKPYYLDSVNNEGKPMCSQCGKTFPSMKSLFGHMRCHPERVWRGILPPPNINGLIKPAANNVVVSGSSSSNSLSIINNDDDEKKPVDLTKFLRGWGVTEKRGRPSLKRFNSDDDYDENDEDEDGVLLEAVEDLMSLAKGNNDNFVTKFEGSNSSTFVNSKDVNLELDDDFGDQSDQFDGYKMKNYDNVGYKNSVYSSKMKKRKKMKLMMELELEEQQIVGDNECKYKCTTCNKCFNSHQALGGHRSSHNKSNKIIHDHQDNDHHHYESNIVVMDNDHQKAELAAAAHQFAGDQYHHYSSVISSNVVHQCKICDKVFPTGQALGGHKRCHWTGLTEPVQAPSSQITSAGEGGGSQSGSGCRKVLDFDLNEIPIPIPMEDQDGITIGLGNEYASSSYNSNMG